MESSVNELARICAESVDAAEWEELLRLSTPLIALTAARVCRLWTGSVVPALVDDIVQDVFVKICEQDRKILREFKPRAKDSFLGLLRIVTVSVANDCFRRLYTAKRGGNSSTLSLDESSDSPVSQQTVRTIHTSVLYGQLDQLLRSAPENISERDRSLFWLYYLHGFTAEELAGMYGSGLSSKGVESALRRVVNWLRGEMNKKNSGNLLRSPQGETAG